MCDVGTIVNTDTAANNADAIMAVLDYYEPWHGTPLLLELMNFQDEAYAPLLMGDGAESYLLLISDGRDTCGTSQDPLSGVPDATPSALANATRKLKDNMALKTIAVGVGDDIEPDQLSAIAEAGGTQFTDFLDATVVEDLYAVMESIGQEVSVSCTYDIGEQDEETVNLDLVNVRFDGEAIPRDDGCVADKGWTWADDDRTVIQFCDKACNTLKSGAVSQVSGEIACRPEDVVVVII
jgi:hypothetical protein